VELRIAIWTVLIVTLILWVILCFIVADGWKSRGLSYEKGFWVSFFFSPVVGILLGIFYVSGPREELKTAESGELKSEVTSKVNFDITAEELAKLKELAGEDAVTFAFATDKEWVCVCGTRNPLDKTKKIQNCSHCHRNRDFVLENYGKQNKKSL